MNFIKSLIIFIISCCILYLFYSYVSIPFVCIFTLYIYIYIGSRWNCIDSRSCVLLFLLLCIVGIIVYGINVCFAIRYYPEYGNVLSIIFDVINIIAYTGGITTMFPELAKDVRKRYGVKPYNSTKYSNDDIPVKDMLVQKRDDE